MRDIRFRAWDEELKQMVSESELDSCENSLNCGELIIGRFDNNEDWYELKRLQFTGLKDKNEKEIYEGDIVKWHNGKGIVEYDNLNGMFMVDGIYDFKDEYKTWKVIGNIYENSNLCEEIK